jgi:hypothetical protein
MNNNPSPNTTTIRSVAGTATTAENAEADRELRAQVMDELVRQVHEEFASYTPDWAGGGFRFDPLLVCLTSDGLSARRRTGTEIADDTGPDEWLIDEVRRVKPLACAWAFVTREELSPSGLRLPVIWLEGFGGESSVATAAELVHLIPDLRPTLGVGGRGCDDDTRVAPWTLEMLQGTSRPNGKPPHPRDDSWLEDEARSLPAG